MMKSLPAFLFGVGLTMLGLAPVVNHFETKAQTANDALVANYQNRVRERIIYLCHLDDGTTVAVSNPDTCKEVPRIMQRVKELKGE